MLTRRSLLVLAGASALMSTLLPPALRAQDDGAASFVRTNGERILQLAPQAEADAGARQQLLTLVNQALYVDGIARFALGPYARSATPMQLRKYYQLFHQVISNGVTARLSTYSNATFTLGRTSPEGDSTLVQSTITRPGSPAADVDWLVARIGGAMKIIDVIAEGTSLRQTERSDYTSYLQNHGGSFDALLAALAKQVEQ